jgi:sialate O-acetylesterase
MLGSSACMAELKMDPLFSDNMVLQRGLEVKVFGMADPGAEVRVEFNGQKVSGKADRGGKWLIRLAPMDAAGGPLQLKASSGAISLVFNNIAVGDVWVCSGQSNMEIILPDSANAAPEIAAANYSQIRLYKANAPWQVCSPETITHFSAVGYYFGRELHRKLNVPIGLISAAIGATAIELWIPIKALEDDPALNYLVKDYNRALQDFPARQKKIEAEMAAWDQDQRPTVQTDPGDKGFEKGYARLDFDDSGWKTMEVPKPWESVMDIDGAVWFRKEVEIPAQWAGQDLHLELGPVDDFDVTYFNGEKVGAIGLETPLYHSVMRKYAVPATLVKKGRAVVAVRVFDHFAAGGFTGAAMMMQLYAGDQDDNISLAGPWHYKVEVQLDPQSLKWPVKPGVSLGVPNLAAAYSSKIAPLIPFAIKGVIWYQGESNEPNAGQYAQLLKVMIKAWRDNWGQAPSSTAPGSGTSGGDFPFLMVQLASLGNPCEFQDKAPWAVLRDAQFSVAESLPNCGIATAIDIGDAKDIHPKNKLDVGRRLALVALKQTYGKDIVCYGPVYDSMKIQRGKIRIKFKNVGSGLVTNGAMPQGFVIAGSDGNFLRAKAAIDGDSVIVWNDTISKPKHVAYAWSKNPETANLCNKEGLPAFPFRTDIEHKDANNLAR